MLDIISMATLLIIMLIVAIFMILIIIGSNIEKSEYERYLEDKEQQAYIKDYMEQKKNKKNCIVDILQLYNSFFVFVLIE